MIHIPSACVRDDVRIGPQRGRAPERCGRTAPGEVEVVLSQNLEVDIVLARFGRYFFAIAPSLAFARAQTQTLWESTHVTQSP
jgi:hypothetical protein